MMSSIQSFFLIFPILDGEKLLMASIIANQFDEFFKLRIELSGLISSMSCLIFCGRRKTFVLEIQKDQLGQIMGNK